MNYVLGIDQSTQGTKLVLFDEEGSITARVDRAHDQIINDKGWVSHDMQQVWNNILDALRELVSDYDLNGENRIAAVGISNQRETTVAWGADGTPLCPAIVWQCGRAADIAAEQEPMSQEIYDRTGLTLSPFYPAAKMAWLLRDFEAQGKDPAAMCGSLHLGTVDSYLIYRMTKGACFGTDASNASRTQLMHLETLSWDPVILDAFGIQEWMLPEILDSDSNFGTTDFDGILAEKIPVAAALGDSHAALFGHGCHKPGMTKTTYGTGSSIMSNTGSELRRIEGLSSCVAYRAFGQTAYCVEGNINYTGAVISWLKNDVHLIDSVSELEPLIREANPEDEAVLVPAFTGLSAPWWAPDARAALMNMSRTTGRAEIAKAATESIAMQITDILERIAPSELRVDGGPTKNAWLMQFQADMAGCRIRVPAHEELSAMGAAFLAGISTGVYDADRLFAEQHYTDYTPGMEEEKVQHKRQIWKDAVFSVLK